MAAVIDPNFNRFIEPSVSRRYHYNLRKQEIKDLKAKEKAEYIESLLNIEELKQSKMNEGMTKREARLFVKPSLINLKDRHRAKLKEFKSLNKENRMVIFPFRLFYTPIVYNGSKLLKPRGRAFAAFLVLVVIFLISFYFIEPDNVIFNFDNLGDIFSQLFGPQGGMSSLHTWGEWWGYMGNTAVPLIWDTFMMMFVATVIGSIVSIPFMILCAQNIFKNRGVTTTFHVLLNIIRTFPTVVLAVIGVAFFGISNLAGIFAMVVFTAGIMIKIMYEFIETVDMHPYEASISSGASKPQAFVVSIVPQIIPAYLSNVLYTFEINIRASVVLGFVGAGGIGTEISNAMGMYQYNKIGAILIPLFILVVALQLLSNFVKKRTM